MEAISSIEIGRQLELLAVEVTSEEMANRMFANMGDEHLSAVFSARFRSSWFRVEDKWFSQDSRVIEKHNKLRFDSGDTWILRSRDVGPRGKERCASYFTPYSLLKGDVNDKECPADEG
jgi:hypothetical protein